MSMIQALDEILGSFPEEQVREVLDFARFLQLRQEQEQWRRFGAQSLARAYGPDEPEYTEADIKSRQT